MLTSLKLSLLRCFAVLLMIPHGNMVFPHLNHLTFNHTIFPGAILIKVLQSPTTLPGISWEDRCLQSVKVSKCPTITDHSVDLGNIMEACGGNF